MYFALLGDFKDSDVKEEEGDKEIVDAGILAIERLNKKYCSDGKKNIFLFK